MTFLSQQYKLKQKLLRKVVKACQHLLITSDKAIIARRYLNSRLDKEDQMSWKFGYFPTDDNLNDLLSMVNKSDLEILRLYYPKFINGGSAPHGHFSDHNLIMPFYNDHGDIISLVGRCLLSEEEMLKTDIRKYNYSIGWGKNLFTYGLNKARDSIIKKNCVICVEGQFDAINLHAHGITNSVAFGWANITRYQMFQIHRYTNNIIVMFDNDEAGQKGKRRVKEKYKDIANIKLISPPEGFKDIDEFLRVSKDTNEISYVIDMLNSFENM